MKPTLFLCSFLCIILTVQSQPAGSKNGNGGNSIKNSDFYIRKDSGSTSIPIAGVGDIKTKYLTEFYFEKQSKKLVKVIHTKHSSVDTKTTYSYLNDTLIRVDETISKIKNERDKTLIVVFEGGKFRTSNAPYAYIKEDIESFLENSTRYQNQAKKFK